MLNKTKISYVTEGNRLILNFNLGNPVERAIFSMLDKLHVGNSIRLNPISQIIIVMSERLTKEVEEQNEKAQ